MSDEQLKEIRHLAGRVEQNLEKQLEIAQKLHEEQKDMVATAYN